MPGEMGEIFKAMALVTRTSQRPCAASRCRTCATCSEHANIGAARDHPESRMPDIVNVILLGIIEGITEFLPISSTGHLLIAEQWLGARSDLFNIAIQAGAILAVVLIFWRRLFELVTRLDRAGEPRLPRQARARHRDHARRRASSRRRLGFELPETVMPIATALIVGGVAILAIERVHRPPAADHGGNLAAWRSGSAPARFSPASFRAPRVRPRPYSPQCSRVSRRALRPPSSPSSSAFRRCLPRRRMSI